MGRLKFLKHYLQEFSFINPKKLIFNGNFICYVKAKYVYKKNMRISSSSKYLLYLESEDKQFIGTMLVAADKFGKAKIGSEFGHFSVISSKKGEIRFSRNTNPIESINEVAKSARKIVIQSILVLLFLLIPSITYLLLFLS